jgi:hypothetical protein
MTALFIDTNILLHFRTFDEISWNKIAGDDYELQIAPIVLDELDKHKNNQNSKTAQRARMIAAKFEQIMDEPKGKTPINFIARRPQASYFDEYQLDPKHQDDCLIASIFQYKTENPTTAIKLISDDLGVKLKSKTLGIEVHKLGNELRLPETLDKNLKEIERLKKQLVELKERAPKVLISFENKVTHFKKTIETNVKTLLKYKEDELAKIKREYPPIQMKQENTDTQNIFEVVNGMNGIFGLSDERRKEYNLLLNEFYQTYDQYLQKQYASVMKRLMSFKLVFHLYNEGTTPATDIDVWLHLPDGFLVEKKYAEEPKKPEPPYRPKNNFDFERINPPSLNFINRISSVNQIPQINPDKPTVRKTNSYEVTYHCNSLKHGLTHKFEAIVLQYEHFEDMKSFAIDYRLNISNVPTPIEGQLHIILDQLN